MKIVKMRVGKVLDLTTNELLYNVEFKFENQHRFMGYSIENWKDIWDARLAIQMHDRGTTTFHPVGTDKNGKVFMSNSHYLYKISSKNHKSNHEQTNSKCSNRND